MRRARITGRGCCYYHVISRVIGQRYFLGTDEKDVFRDMMWRVAEFSGVQIITYTVMDNHFHMLIQIPEAKQISEDEVLRRMSLIYRGRDWDRVVRHYERVKEAGSITWLQEWLKQYTDRMWDLSEFMKTLKSRYTIWYNTNHEDRVGTLWSDRFRSVLIEPLQNASGRAALALIASYIELNAVRAGIVGDPKEYTWCGYRDALAGYTPARVGILHLFGGSLFFWRRGLRLYRRWWKRKLPSNAGNLLQHRFRGFSYGVFLGSEQFVEHMRRERVNTFKSNYSIPVHDEESESGGRIFSLRYKGC